MQKRTHLSRLVYLSLFFYSLPLYVFSMGNSLRFDYLTIDDGLSQSDVTAIVQDQTGFLWMGTNNGLNFYDGYRFIRWKWDPKATESTISSNTIMSLCAGKDGKVWIATTSSLDAYDPNTAGFINYKRQLEEVIPNTSTFRINKVFCDNKGEIWFCYRDKLLKLNSAGQKIEIWDIKDPMRNLVPGYIQDIKADRHNNLYLASNKGIFFFDTKTKNFRHLYDDKQPEYYLNKQVNSILIEPTGNILAGTVNGLWLLTQRGEIIKEIPLENQKGNIITILCRDSQNQIWAGSRKNGLYLINNIKIQQFKTDRSRQYGLNSNEVLSLYEDNSGILWIGTATGGVNKLILNESLFTNIQHQTGKENTLSDNLVHAIYTEDNETVWLGTHNAVLNEWNKHTNQFTHYPFSSHITAINRKSENELWIGTGAGLKIFNKKTKRITNYLPENRINYSFTSVLYKDKEQTLWCGSGGGICLIDKEGNAVPLRIGTERFKKNVRAITQTKDGDMWIGTRDYGIIHIRRGKESFQFIHNEKWNSIYSDISYIYEDSKERLWIGTWGAGLYQITNRDTLGYCNYSETDGLSDNLIYSIYEDHNGQLWISTCNGLSCFNPEKKLFYKYTSYDGLPGNEFTKGAHFQDAQGMIYLAGINGATFFQPEDIHLRQQASKVAITGLQVYNTTIRPGKEYEGKVILYQDITSTNHITLKYDERHFTFNFITFSYHAPQKNRFAYRLSDIDKEWIYTDEHSSASYSHLNPGTYLFEVKGCNSDGVWNEEPVKMTVTILPPFWASPVAYLVYMVLITILGTVIILWFKRKNELKRVLMQERMYEESQKELYNAKMKFYTNISHELRTPVTLIVGLIEKLENSFKIEGDENKMLGIISKNAQILLRLINDLLDFRKIETGNMQLEQSPQEIAAFIRTICSFFEERAKERNIRLSLYCDDCVNLTLLIDSNKVQRIIYNLLSNAIKFTQTYIEVSVKKETRDEKEWLLISVRNDGKDIAEEEQEKIFSRFYQINTEDSPTPGSGIGLNLCRELAHLHGGEIELFSKPEEGATFTLCLPIIYPEVPQLPISHIPIENEKEEKQLPILLVIDDNEDIRYYMRQLLSEDYEIMEASGGVQGWEMVQRHLPDLVISDVMMPDMDGIELCHNIKTSPDTCHIPVILVTAKLSDASQIQALEYGADSYITKPFTEAHIKAQITNILVSREKLKEQLLKELSNSIGQPEAAPIQDKLLQKIVDTIEANLDDSEYDIDRLSKDIGLSRMHLYRKLKGIIGQTPADFIRDYKLARAAELLKRPDLNVTEVSDLTGFVSPKMFRIYFKKKYNLTPSEYQKKYLPT
jgi:signal transduction histidine kinase/ligand-binding sensor domain-containing protein/DNA-binding response OmpR family regulator